MSNYKVGDEVWVLCKVIEPCESLVKVTPSGNDSWFWAAWEQCRPVEPDQDDHPVEFKVGDRVVSWSGRQGVVEAINEIEGFPIAVRHSMREQVSYKLGGVKHDDHPVEQAPKETTPKEPTQGQKLAERTMKAIWAANDAVNRTPVVKHGDPSGGWEPTKDEIEYAKDRCGVPASDPLAVGDAVRFVSPGHNRHGTEGILKSIHHGPKNAYLFVSDCGQFHSYCTIAELEHYDKAESVDIKGSMASLDGADTIQEGDLQWTDRDGKYRLCNFTIGMRVHEAIQRGKAHGEKWVFYRKFREVGE